MMLVEALEACPFCNLVFVEHHEASAIQEDSLMTSWRMQLHPNFAGGSARHSAECLSAGFVGLDFKWDVGDLLRAVYDDLPKEEKILQRLQDKRFAVEASDNDGNPHSLAKL